MKIYKKTRKPRMEGGETNLKSKHVLISFFTVVFIFFFTPSLSFGQEHDIENQPEENTDTFETSEQSQPNDEETSQEEPIAENTDTESNNNEDIHHQEEAATEDADENLDTDKEAPGASIEEEEVQQKGQTDADENEEDTEIDEETEVTEGISETDEADGSDEAVGMDEEQGEKGEQETEDNKLESGEALSSTALAKKEAKEFKNGDRGAEIKDLKKKLTNLGFGRFPSDPSENYGPVTSGVVKEFQAYYNLPQTGIADEATLAKINEVLEPPYKNGDRGLKIVEIKENLTNLGFGNFPKSPSIFYGNVTENVVKVFQKHFGLNNTGIADQHTLNKITEILNTPYQDGNRGKNIKDLKMDLTNLGFGNFPKDPSKNYGPVTTGVVKEFQAYYNLPQTGLGDEVTLAKIKEILESPYKNGDRGLQIVEIKKNLTNLGFGNFPKNPSIFYGKVTTNVVKEFQSHFGLKNTGVTDQRTLDKISEILNSPYQDGNSGEEIRELKIDLTNLAFGKFPSNPSKKYGSVTAGVVKEFQAYYNLPQSGIADTVTLAKIKEVLEPPYKDGDRGLQIAKIKKNLTNLGFGNFPKNPSVFYGNVTANVVKEFQKFYNLKRDGIVDEITLQTMKEIKNNPYKDGSKGKHIEQLKKHLTRLGFGKFPSNPSKNYGKVTEGVVKEFQTYYRLSQTGEGDRKTIKKINELLNSPYQDGKSGSHIVKLKKDLTRLGFGKFPSNPSKNYGKVTEGVVKEFQKDYQLVVNGIMDDISLNKLKSENKKLNKTVKIFIDPGHGGSDPGASGHGLKEKDITLDIATKLANQLKRYRNVDIKMSRTNDQTVSLSERSKMANDWGADYFISIHNNSCCGATGFESYIHNGNRGTKDAENKQNIIHDQIVKDIDTRDRGKKSANFHVLRETNMSAILLEYLFISTKSDNDKLQKNSFRNQLAKSTATGIAKAFNLVKK